MLWKPNLLEIRREVAEAAKAETQSFADEEGTTEAMRLEPAFMPERILLGRKEVFVLLESMESTEPLPRRCCSLRRLSISV